jgi:branched-chain amino acid transport system ATP-binding protein
LKKFADGFLYTRKGQSGSGEATLEKVYAYFPRLNTAHQAAYTSGGEQQMCAIGYDGQPTMVLLDRPLDGSSAAEIVEEVAHRQRPE